MSDKTDSVTEANSTPSRDFGKTLEKRRWWIITAFSLFSAANQILWITYAPIVSATQDYYGVSVDSVIQFSNSFMYVYFAFSFLGSWLAYKWFTFSVLGAMALNALGGWLRFIGGDNYAIALAGQYLAALSQNVVLFVPVLIADRWFAAHERIWAVSIGTLSNLFGWGFGYIFPTIIIKDGNEDFLKLLLIEAIMSTIPLVMGILSIREKPKVPPSYSASVKAGDNTNYWKELITILKDKRFVLIAICFGNLIGQSYTLSSVIVLFMESSTLIEQGFVGVAFLGCGIASGLIGTIVLSKSKSSNYDRLLKIFMLVSIAGLIALAVTVKLNNYLVILLLNGLLGIGLVGFQPFGAHTLVEMTFPIQESISVNLMMVIAQLFGVIGNYLSTATFVGDNGLWALVGLISPCALYVLFFHKTDTKRQKAEMEYANVGAQNPNHVTAIEMVKA